MIALHLAFAEHPTPRAVRRFDTFIAELRDMLARVEGGKSAEPHPVRLGLLNSISADRPRATARTDMGEKFVDADLCTECGTCAKRCPYEAITLAPKPVFDMGACYGCWRCYNQCPQHAIYTKRFRGGPYYPGPSERTHAALRA